MLANNSKMKRSTKLVKGMMEKSNPSLHDTFNVDMSEIKDGHKTVSVDDHNTVVKKLALTECNLLKVRNQL